jgi:putative ABC transport system permease protein
MLLLLGVLGVALGVASVVTIQVINANALAAFSGGLQAVSGDADLSVLGRLPSVPESLFVRVLGTPGVAAAWPLVRVDTALEGRRDFFLEVIGVDFFAPMRFPVRVREGPETAVSLRPDEALAPVLGESGWAAVTPQLAAERGWAVGDTFAVTSGMRRVPLRVGALVDFRALTPLASPKMIVMDIAQAQSLLGTRGTVTQVDLRIVPGASLAEVAARLRSRLGPAVQVLTPEQREKQATGLLAAFRLNLSALSLVSLFVGLFLVYTTTQASLQRRRFEFGLLRTLGATRGQVLGLILAETLLLGLAGTAIGLPLGYHVARAHVAMVSATLTNLYLLQEISRLELPGRLYLLAVAIGVGGALLGAGFPAIETARRDTRTLFLPFTLHERVRALAGRLAALGGAIMAAAGAWFLLGGRDGKAGGFVLAAALMLGLPLLTPRLVRLLCGWVPARGFGLAYSVKGLSARLHATAFAVAALGVAVSMLFGVTLLVAGFRRTVATWIGATVKADVYVTTESWARGRPEAAVGDSVAAELAALSGVLGVDRLRQFLAYAGERRITLNGIDTSLPGGESRLLLLHGDAREAWRRIREEGAVVIGEPLARKAGLGEGDTLCVAGPSGPVSFPVVGVAYDYTTEAGSAALDLAVMARAFGPGPVNNVALYLEPGVDPEAFSDGLRARYHDRPLVFRSNRRLREEVLAVFDQTFAVTRILQGMALLIAVCGIALTLLVQARERVAELALYRSLGATRGQIFGTFLGEGLGIGVLGLVTGLGGGIGLALILVLVINRAWFGWTIRMHWPAETMVWQGITILAAAALAGIYPALRASRVPATELSRDDF